ncbi:hypothetical protein XarbCFBP7614_08085 [Xanthomonas arboricola]|nr:hypothetical protein XarbCFBP7614_08085 [Xanthomonas arboricola]
MVAPLWMQSKTWVKSLVDRARGALTACGTRRESIRGGSSAASMPPRVPQPARTPHQRVGRLLSSKLILGLRWEDETFVSRVLNACCSACIGS